MRRIHAILLVAVATAACGEDRRMPLEVDPALASVSATGPAAAASYEVTVTNLTTGQPFTPPLAVTHRASLRLFRVGEVAEAGIQQIAENGNLGPALDALAESPHAKGVVVAAEGPIPPVMPGETRSFTISTSEGAQLISFASMLICTNDGFTGVDAERLPRDLGQSVEIDAYAYDAGTEINTEDFDDLVPPCGPLTGVDSGGAGTGMSDPALAEGGTVHPHAGIVGAADLLTSLHGWSEPVARLVVTRVQ